MRYGSEDRESSNVEDRRGQRTGMGFPKGGIPLPIGGKGGLSLGSLLVIGAVMLLLGINPLEVLMSTNEGYFPDIPDLPRNARPTYSDRAPFDLPKASRDQQKSATGEQANDEMGSFVKRVLADTEDVWTGVFQNMGMTYEEPKLVLFSQGTRTACGYGNTLMGPFYCPLDSKIYIDLAFYDELRRRFKAPGDFAQAYVVAHEVGHHVQTLLGISEKVQSLKQRLDERRSNQLQVRMELQADCFAGVWANLNDQLKNRLEDGDIEEGLRAAEAIGDDKIQKNTQGYVIPDSFTHGSSEQRMHWFLNGFRSGQIQNCNTFKAENL